MISRLTDTASSWAIAALPVSAHAGAQSVLPALQIDPQLLPWFTWAWVFGLSVGGWFASSAPTLAGWISDGAGTSPRELWTRRWGIVGRLAACLVAGFACFFAGLLVGTPMVANFLAVLFASYGGDKYMLAQAEKVARRDTPGV